MHYGLCEGKKKFIHNGNIDFFIHHRRDDKKYQGDINTRVIRRACISRLTWMCSGPVWAQWTAV